MENLNNWEYIISIKYMDNKKDLILNIFILSRK